MQESRIGDILVLTHFSQEDENTAHLRRHGLVEGTQLVVLKSGSRPLVRCGTSTIALSPEMANRMEVAVVGNEDVSPGSVSFAPLRRVRRQSTAW